MGPLGTFSVSWMPTWGNWASPAMAYPTPPWKRYLEELRLLGVHPPWSSAGGCPQPGGFASPGWWVPAAVFNAPSHPQIFLKVAQDTGVDADTAGKMSRCWLELRVLGCRGDLGGEAQQPGAEGCGCPQHPLWSLLFTGLGAPMGAGRCHRLWPWSHPGALTPVLSGTGRGAAPGEGGDVEAADGELGKERGAQTWDP